MPRENVRGEFDFLININIERLAARTMLRDLTPPQRCLADFMSEISQEASAPVGWPAWSMRAGKYLSKGAASTDGSCHRGPSGSVTATLQ